MNRYELKRIPSDFQVQEVLHLERVPFNDAVYYYYYLEKVGITTFEAIQHLASSLDINANEIGYAGLKDEDAETLQYISLPIYLTPSKLDEVNDKISTNKLFVLHIKYFGAGKNPLKVAKLHGNCFRLKIRNLEQEQMYLFEGRKEYTLHFINYYGSQRFGLPNQVKNTHLIGKAIHDMDYECARKELAKQDSEYGTLARDLTNQTLPFFENINKNILAFYQSAYYSYLWNQKIAAYLSTAQVLSKKETLDQIDFILPINDKDILNLLKKHSTLSNVRVVSSDEIFEEVEYNRNTVIQTKIYIEKISDDDLNIGKSSIYLSFYLPAGCYATVAIAQFIQNFNELHKATLNANKTFLI